MKPAHILAQEALVRMLHDPGFAARVRAAPDDTLPQLPTELRRQLAAIDARALHHDRLRGRRLLRTLFDEYKASTTYLLAKERQLAALDRFFAGEPFAQAVAGRHALHVAYAAFLVRDGGVPIDLVGIELMLAEARRPKAPARDGRLWRAPGVECTATTRGALATLQAIERYLYEVNLMPAVALCVDGPPLALPAPDGEPLHLVAVPAEAGQTLVEIEPPLYQQLSSLPQPWTPALQPLIDDELAVRA